MPDTSAARLKPLPNVLCFLVAAARVWTRSGLDRVGVCVFAFTCVCVLVFMCVCVCVYVCVCACVCVACVCVYVCVYVCVGGVQVVCTRMRVCAYNASYIPLYN